MLATSQTERYGRRNSVGNSNEGLIRALSFLFSLLNPSSLITGRFSLEDGRRSLEEKRHVIKNDGLRRVITPSSPFHSLLKVSFRRRFLGPGLLLFVRRIPF